MNVKLTCSDLHTTCDVFVAFLKTTDKKFRWITIVQTGEKSIELIQRGIIANIFTMLVFTEEEEEEKEAMPGLITNRSLTRIIVDTRTSVVVVRGHDQYSDDEDRRVDVLAVEYDPSLRESESIS